MRASRDCRTYDRRTRRIGAGSGDGTGRPDLKFRGRLIASIGPDLAKNGRWHEFRVYETKGGKKVFSKVGRSVWKDERDKFVASVFDPGARDLTFGTYDPTIKKYKTEAARARAEKDEMTTFFGFNDLAKKLYAKLGLGTEETID